MTAMSLPHRLGQWTRRARHGQCRQGTEARCPGSPPAEDAARLAVFLSEYSCWSVFWDKKYAVWRAAEDDPCSVLYAEAADVDAVISFITAHT
jgi:hypothetical protein